MERAARPGTLAADFRQDDFGEAIARCSAPEGADSDQGRQFTGFEPAELLQNHDIAIDTDGKCCWRDGAFLDRLRKNVEYVDIYLKADTTVLAVKAGLGNCPRLYPTKPAATLIVNASSVVLKPNATIPCVMTKRRIGVLAIATSAVWEVIPTTMEKYRKSM